MLEVLLHINPKALMHKEYAEPIARKMLCLGYLFCVYFGAE